MTKHFKFFKLKNYPALGTPHFITGMRPHKMN